MTIRIVLGSITEVGGGTALVHVRAPIGAPVSAALFAGGAWHQLVATPVQADAQLSSQVLALGVRSFALRVPPLGPGSFELEASCNGEQAFAVFRPIPEAAGPPLNFALASCYYGYLKESASYGEKLVEASQTARWGKGPIDFKLYIGDNLYLDIAPDQTAFKDGYKETAARYVRYFVDDAPYVAANASSPTLLTFDDHEYWNDYPYSSLWLDRTRGDERKTYEPAAHAGVDAFQAILNPPHAPNQSRSFELVSRGVHFFVADSRSCRTEAEGQNAGFMPWPDFERMLAWIGGREGPRVLILGQPLWQEGISKTGPIVGDHNLAAYSAQYAELWRALHDAPWEILVLTGDVHFSRVLRLETGGRSVYEIVSSPAVHIPAELNTILHYVFQTFGVKLGDQGGDTPNLDGPHFDGNPAYRPSLADYVYGTSSRNAFATIEIERVGDARADVSVAFVDHAKGLMPAPETIQKKTPSTKDFPVRFTLRMRT